MTGKALSMKMVAMALALVVFAAVLVPLCVMPECAEASTAPCSDFKPACDECPPQMVMKHTHDEAVTKAPAPAFEPVALGTVVALPVDAVRVAALVLPEVTASPPPPLSPLGVRLTI